MMNIQPGNSSTRRKDVRREDRDNSGGVRALCGLLARVLHTAVIVAVIGVFFHTYIKLEQQKDAVVAEIRSVNERIAEVDREIEGLRGAYADRSSQQYISAQIRRFRLPLVPTRLSQRCNMHVYGSDLLARVAYPMSSPQVAESRRSAPRRAGTR